MKNLVIIISVGILMIACKADNTDTTIVSILEDQTEADFLATPDYQTTLSVLGVDRNIWNGYRFRYGPLNDLSLNKRFELTLEGKPALFENELERKKHVAHFKKGIEDILSNPQDTLGRNHSAIWEPIVEEIQSLQQDSLSQSLLYVFSDLRENAGWFSTYRYKDSLSLINDSKHVQGLYLEKAKSLKPSELVKVVVVYQPRDQDQDAYFKKMQGLYRLIFQKLDIQIEFVANLNTTAP